MKLRVLDQINVTAVRSETLQPREEIEVSDEQGKALLKAHPGAFAEIAEAPDEPEAKAAPAPANKARKAAPANKAAAAKKSKG